MRIASALLVGLALLACACGVGADSASDGCPPGTSLAGAAPPEGLEQWCEARDTQGRSERHGPWRSWYPSGSLRAHGEYARGSPHGATLHLDASGRRTRVVYFERGSIVAQDDYLRSIVWRLEPADGTCAAPLVAARASGPSGQSAAGCVRVTESALLQEGQWEYRDASGVVIASGEFRQGRREGDWMLRGRDGIANPVGTMPSRGPLVLDEIFPDP